MDLTNNLVLDLVKLGFLGFGALIFVMGFIIIMRNQPAAAGIAKLRSQLLTLGFAAFLVAAIVQVLPLFLGSTLTLAVSPDFAEATLPAPKIMMGNKQLATNEPFGVSGNQTINIAVDGALNKVRELNAQKAVLEQSGNALLKANLSLMNEVKTPGPNQFWTTGKINELSNVSTEIKTSIDKADFAKVNELNQKILAITPPN